MNPERQKSLFTAERVGDVEMSPTSTGGGAPALYRAAATSLRALRSSVGAPGRLLSAVALPRPPFYLTSFILLVVIPAFAAIVYLMAIASDQYAAEARFAVRSGRDDAGKDMAAISSLSQGGGLTAPSVVGQDAHVIVSYIRSRAIVDDLAPKIDLRGIFRRPEADFWARLSGEAPVEALTDYWRKMVTANVDGPSGIVTLSVRAFRPDDALALATAVLGASEDLANAMSDRARRDGLSRAEAEVQRTEGMVRQALSDMRTFRESVGFIDPNAAATATSKLIAESMVEKIKLENELFVASRLMSPNAPTLASTNLKLQSVNDQIAKLKATITGKNASDSVISKSLVKFEEIELRRIFAEKLYLMAQDDLERSRIAADRKNVYVTVFVPPRLPEEASFPERLRLSVVITVMLLILWGIFALTVAAIEDHRI